MRPKLEPQFGEPKSNCACKYKIGLIMALDTWSLTFVCARQQILKLFLFLFSFFILDYGLN